MSTLLYRLGHAVARRARRVILAWVVILVTVIGLAGTLGGVLEDDFSIPGTSSQQGIDTLDLRFPAASGGSAQLVYGVPDGERIDDAGVREEVDAALERVRALDDVSDADDPYEDDAAISPDGRYALVTVQYEVPGTEIGEADRDALEAAAAPGAGITVDFGGQVYTDRGVGLSIVEAIGVLVAFVVLLLTFRSALAAAMPLVMTLVGAGIALGGILLTAALTPVSTATPSLAIMIGLAVGIDYGLFILSRHRHELALGSSVPEAIARSLATAGSAVVFAGATVIIALTGLTVAGIPFLGVMGIAAACTVAVAMASTLTLFPALLALFGERLRPRPRRAPRARRGGRPRRAGRLGDAWVALTKRHPILTIVATAALLLLPLIPASDLRLALSDNGSAEPGTDARGTYDLIAEEFGPGYNAPLIVTADILASTTPLDTVDELAADLDAIPGVASIARATPNPTGDLALFRVIPEHAQGDERTIALVHELRAQATALEEEHGASDLTVTGITAVSIDTSERLTAALVPFALIVAGLSFLLSMVVFRSIAIPIKATFGFLLSTSAAFGVVSAVYSWGWFAELLHVQATGPVISFFPIMVIGVLFGLSMDYEVFLVARVREEYIRSGDPVAAVDEGYRQSQTVVNAAGLIMVAVFVAFIPHASATVKPLALGLAVGVFVDAFIVRATLARAVLYLLGPRAWWLPRWLDRRLPHLDVEGAAMEADIHAREEAALRPELVLRSTAPALELHRGETRSLVLADDERRHATTRALSGGRGAAADLTLFGRALPAGAAMARRRVVRLDADPFADRVPPRVDAVGVVRRYFLARGLPRASEAEVDRVLDIAGLPTDRARWSLLDRRRLDIALAECGGAQLLILDDLDHALTPAESARLLAAAVASDIPTTLVASRAPLGDPTIREVRA